MHADTVEFFLKHFELPRITNSTYLRQPAEDIISILSNKKSIYSRPSLSFGTPILSNYLHIARILRRDVQTSPTPRPRLPPNIYKLPSSLPRVLTPSLPRVNPPPLPRVPTSTPHRYPTRHTRHQQHRPIISTAASVIDTNTGAKSSLHTLRSGPKKVTSEISTANNFFCLAQDEGKSGLPSKRVEGTNTIIFVSKQAIPKGKKITFNPMDNTL